MKQVLYFLSLVVFLHSCKSKETVTPNRPPSAFTVTQTLKSDGKTIVLNWTKAKDPDGDAVTYAVVLKDTLVKNINDTTYTIASLDFNYSQAGKVIAKDSKGLMSEASFTAVTKVQTFVAIPDTNFEKYLVEEKIDKDGLVNSRMDADDAKGVTRIAINSKNIKSLAGIEAFTELQYLDCSSNQLTALDISNNVNLQTLWCFDNQLTVLDVSKNVNLQTFGFFNNQLTALDVSKNINLQYLSCSYNKLTVLDISKNVNLQILYCGDNPLTVLDVSKNVNLKTLWCFDNKLTVLDVSKNVNLQILYCGGNQLTVLDVSKNVKLKELSCNNNQLTVLDISKNVNLEDLWCYNNPIKTICVSDVDKANIRPNWRKPSTATYSLCK